MFKKKYLGLAIAATLAAGSVQAALETSVTLKNETAWMVKDGIRTGEATSTTDTTGEGKGVYKSENTAKIFLNDELDNGMSWHGELQVVRDTKAIDGYDGHEPNTQKDFLRELYVDTKAGDWDVRLGKQQVVWGTADGIKLLDMINPTDWSEFNQNTMAEARIPVWMFNAEKYLDNGANVQFIVSQPKENKIAGFNSTGDQGHPFIMKGVDTISGKVNGFYNIAPALSNVAGTFNNAAAAGMFDNRALAADGTATGAQNNAGLTPFGGMTVAGFAHSNWQMYDNADAPSAPAAGTPPSYVGLTQTAMTNGADGIGSGDYFLNVFAQFGFAGFGSPGEVNGNGNVTNLEEGTGNWTPENPTSAFEYMPLATFATFNTFTSGTMIDADLDGNVDNPWFTGISKEWVVRKPDGANFATRFRNTTSNGLNYSVNYAYAYGSNPDVGINWVDPNSKAKLNVFRAPTVCYDTSTYTALTNTITAGPDNSCTTGVDAYAPYLGNPSMTRDQVAGALAQGGSVTALVQNDAGEFYGAINPEQWVADYTTAMGAGPRADLSTLNQIDANMAPDTVVTQTAVSATSGGQNVAPMLQFEQTMHRSHMLGASFDYSIDFENPVVLRGEFLYEKDSTQPVVDRMLLAIGDLGSALKMEKADYFKYVIGADTTVMTDMMLSGQFIQFRNLDYINQSGTCNTQGNLGLMAPATDAMPNPGAAYTSTVRQVDCSRYTADMPTMSLSNGMQKAEENKNFYSLFFSKPFGESGEGRWNNIFIYEEGGGKWNRFDVEYGFDDQLIGTFEVNKYFGDENTMFGQFENASNIQVGLKYLLQ